MLASRMAWHNTHSLERLLLHALETRSRYSSCPTLCTYS